MSNTLYHTYRPRKFADVIGQKHIVTTITNAIAHDRLGQAYLFTGPRGTGKTTMARLLAKAVTCGARVGSEPCLACPHCLAVAEESSLDIIEIDAASNTGVDNIRELRDSIKLLPTQAPFKVYIIDEVHMLSIGAFNALLKTLEEPPKHVIFILATTSLHKVPDTIVSRCQRFDFSRLPIDRIIEKLAGIAKNEGVAIDAPALEMIALAAEGGMRDAESLLTQVIALEDKHITAEEVSSILGITDRQHVEELIAHIADADLSESVLAVNRLVESGIDMHIFADSLLHSLRQTLLISIDAKLAQTLAVELTQEHIEKLSAFAEKITSSGIIRLIELVQTARKDIRTASIPQLPLEIAIMRFLIPESENMAPVRQTPHNRTSQPAIAKAPEIPKDITPIVKEPEILYAAADEPAHDAKTDSAAENETGITTDIDTVKSKWQAVLDRTREMNSSLSMTLGNGQPMRIENATLVLGVRFPMYKDKLNAIENRLTVESALDTILGTKIRLQVVIDESASPQRQVGFAGTDNPILSEAMNILGGRIVA